MEETLWKGFSKRTRLPQSTKSRHRGLPQNGGRNLKDPSTIYNLQKKRMQKSGNEAARLLGLKFSNFIKQPAQQHYHVDFLSVGKRLGLQ